MLMEMMTTMLSDDKYKDDSKKLFTTQDRYHISSINDDDAAIMTSMMTAIMTSMMTAIMTSLMTAIMTSMMTAVIPPRLATISSDTGESTESRTKWFQQPNTRFDFLDIIVTINMI